MKKFSYDEIVADTKRQMRVLIAKDVLELLAEEKLIASPGTYLRTGMDIQESWVTRDAQVGEKLLKKPCEVCAMGAMFVAEVVRNDKLGFKQLSEETNVNTGSPLNLGRHLMDDRLEQFFPKQELCEIEAYFERDHQQVDGVFWIDTYPEARRRLRAIMQNIVRNKGAFKPLEQKIFLAARRHSRKQRILGGGKAIKNGKGKTVMQYRKKPAAKG